MDGDVGMFLPTVMPFALRDRIAYVPIQISLDGHKPISDIAKVAIAIGGSREETMIAMGGLGAPFAQAAASASRMSFSYQGKMFLNVRLGDVKTAYNRATELCGR
jgi:hypothetical protein